MSEEANVAVEPAAAVTPAPEPAPEPAPAVAEPVQSFVDGKGNFKEGWENAFLTEDQKANARVSGGRVKSVQGLLDTVINSDKMISGDKILRPSDNFGDADWDAYHSAGGWTNQPVEITAPEGLPDGLWSDDRAKGFSEVFNALRLNPKQVAGIMEAFNADVSKQLTDFQNADQASMAELKAGLLADKGNAYTQFEHNGNYAITKGADNKEHQDRIAQKFGADPDFIRLMGNLGSQFGEAPAVNAEKMAATPNDIQTKINDIMKSDAFMVATHPDHKETMKTIGRLHIEKAKIKSPV